MCRAALLARFSLSKIRTRSEKARPSGKSVGGELVLSDRVEVLGEKRFEAVLERSVRLLQPFLECDLTEEHMKRREASLAAFWSLGKSSRFIQATHSSSNPSRS